MIKELISQTLDKKHNVDQRKLAQVGNVNESSISRFLNGYDELNFESTFRIIKFLFPEREIELMSHFIKTVKSKSARLALEYCEMNNLSDLTSHLLELLYASTNPVDKEWATIYDLMRSLRAREYDSRTLLGKIETIKPKEPEMQIFKMLLKGYVYFELNEHRNLSFHMNGIEELISELKSQFIKDSFIVRLGLIMNYVSLYANDLENAREYSQRIIDQDFFENVKGTAYHHLGHSYMLEDFDKSEYYLSKALDIFQTESRRFEKIHRTMLNISFLNSLWKKPYDFNLPLDAQENLFNFVFHLISKGELSEALSTLDTIELKNDWYKAFYYYYKGLMTNDENDFFKSVGYFHNIDDYFHLQLPLKELQRLGSNEVILRIISSRRNFNGEDIQSTHSI